MLRFSEKSWIFFFGVGFFLFTVSMQKKHIFRLVAFSERFWQFKGHTSPYSFFPSTLHQNLHMEIPPGENLWCFVTQTQWITLFCLRRKQIVICQSLKTKFTGQIRNIKYKVCMFWSKCQFNFISALKTQWFSTYSTRIRMTQTQRISWTKQIGFPGLKTELQSGK